MKLNTSLFFLFLILFTSCATMQECKLYSDGSASAEVFLRIDPSITQKMKPISGDSAGKKIHGKNIEDLPKGWVSFYDLFPDSIKVSGDTAELFKHLYIKYLIEKGQFVGMGMKSERLQGGDLSDFSRSFNQLNPGKNLDSLRPEFGIEPKSHWDGKILTLKVGNTNQTNSKNSPKNSKEKKNKENAFTPSSILKEANIVMTYKFSFEKKIKKVKGKNDLFRKVNDYTVQYEIDFRKLFQLVEEGKALHKRDPVIYVVTE